MNRRFLLKKCSSIVLLTKPLQNVQLNSIVVSFSKPVIQYFYKNRKLQINSFTREIGELNKSLQHNSYNKSNKSYTNKTA